MRQYRVKPSKPTSVLALAVGLLLVALGFIMAIPQFGVFGIVWTLVAAAITVYHAVNLFTDRGVANQVVTAEGDPNPPPELPFDERLRRLDKLRADGLLTDDEYGRKRAEILGERW
jgi:hypothetical protein